MAVRSVCQRICRSRVMAFVVLSSPPTYMPLLCTLDLLVNR